MKSKCKVFLSVTFSVAMFLISAQAVKAESLAVLDVYVHPRLPLDSLYGVVEPYGDDIFAAERKGLERTLRRLVHGMVKQNSDYAVKKLVDPVSLGVNPERVFMYYRNDEDPEAYYDRVLLLKIADELSTDLILVGMVRELEVKSPETGPEWVKMKIAFSLYDANADAFVYTQTYENNTDDVTGYVDPEVLPKIHGRLPSDIERFIDNEAGRVFMAIAEVFVSDLTSSEIDKYLSDAYHVEGNTGYVDPSEYAEAPTDGRTPPPGMTDVPGSAENQPANSTTAKCTDRGQAMVVVPPATGNGLKIFACYDGFYDLGDPDQKTGAVMKSPEGLGSLSAGDFDGDGIDELVVTSYRPGEYVRIYWTHKRGIDIDDDFEEASQLIPGIEVGVHAVAGDFDGDGMAELAVSAATGMDYTQVFDFVDNRLVTDSTMITFRDVIGTIPRGTFIAAGDFNGDGTDDLAVASNGSGEKVKVFSLPSGTRTRPMLLGDLKDFFGGDSKSISVAAGDFDADGKDELVVSALDHGVKIKVLAYRDGGFELKNPMTNIRTDANAVNNGARVTAGDLDGDGADDLVVSMKGTPEPELWVFRYGNGAFDLNNPYISSSAIFPSAPSGLLLTVGKFE